MWLLSPRPCGAAVALTAFYYDAESNAQYASTFYNDTITFYENTGIVDFDLVKMVFTLMVLAGAIMAAVAQSGSVPATLLKKIGTLGKAGGSRARSDTAAVKAGGSAEDWLAGTSVAASAKKAKADAEKKAKAAAAAEAKAAAKAEAAAAKAAAEEQAKAAAAAAAAEKAAAKSKAAAAAKAAPAAGKKGGKK